MIFLPSALWTVISLRATYRCKKNAREMALNLKALRSNGTTNETAIMFTRAEMLVDYLRTFVFANASILGILSFFFVAEMPWTQVDLALRLYADYTLTVLIGSFAVFAVNAEIYGYAIDKAKGRS